MTTLSFREPNPDATLGYTGRVVSPQHPLPVRLVQEGGTPVTGVGGAALPTGDERQVMGFGATGEAEAITLGWAQLSDQPVPPAFDNGVLTMARNPATQEDEFGIVELGVDASFNSVATPNTIPVYQSGVTGGQLPVATPTAATHAATKAYVDTSIASKTGLIVPAAPATGTYQLTATGGVLSWVAVAE